MSYGSNRLQDLILNRGSKYYDQKGQLKEGYSFEGGPDSVATGTVKESYSVGAGRDGLQQRTRDKTVYKTGDFSNGNGNGNQEEERGFPRDTGEFDDIIGALGDDVAAANARADEYANEASKNIGNNTDLIGNLGQQFQDQLAALTQGQEQRYAALESVLNQQSQAMAQSQAMMQQQMMAAQQSYNEQLRLMQNMQRANVPEAEENAFTAQIGDQRESTARKKEDNQLSDLSILSGLGTQGSPTAGFSLA